MSSKRVDSLGSLSSFEHVKLGGESEGESTRNNSLELDTATHGTRQAEAAGGAAEPSASVKEAVPTAPSADGGGAPAAAPAAAVVGRPPRTPGTSTPGTPASNALKSVFGLFGNSGEAPPAALEGEAGTSTSDPIQAELLEAAEQAKHAVEGLARDAKEGLSSIATGLTSWWTTLDPTKEFQMPRLGGASAGSGAGAGGGAEAAAARGAPAAGALHSQLGLESGEEVMESFSCQLLQTYTASNNFFTPVKQVPFQGHLHITSQRVCFTADEEGIAPIKVAAKAVAGVSKQPAAAEGPLRVVVQLRQKGQSLVFTSFALQELEMDSALALLEHITSA